MGSRRRAALVITFLLAEAEVELMPAEIARDPKVQARAKKRRRAAEHLLLDQAADHEAMRSLPEGDRRGRPDIVHLCALLLLDSPLAARGEIRLLVHTRRDVLITPRAAWRPPRSQAKTYQLLEDGLRQGSVPHGDPILVAERGVTLREALGRCAGARVLLDETGEAARTAAFEDIARTHADLTLVLGAFPRGGFRQVDARDFDRTLRVAATPISAWSALVPALAGCEDARLDRTM